jgi:hypothetical protein
MQFRLHNAPAIMQSFRFRYKNIPVTAIKPLLEKWFEMAASLPRDCFSAFVLNSRSVYVLITTTNKNSKSIDPQLEALKALTTKFDHTLPKPLEEALKVFYAEASPIYFKNASAGLYKGFEDIDPCIDEVIKVVRSAPGMLYQVNTLGGEVQRSVHESVSCFPYRAFGFFSELQTYYENPKQAPALLSKFEAIQNIFYNHGIRAQYRNYPDINFNNPLELYYGKSLTRLQKLKKEFDPENNIRHEQSIL